MWEKNKKMKVYLFMRYEYLYNMIANDEVKVILPSECNDPLEFVPYGSEHALQNELHGMICFSQDCNNSAMWGHYADKHKGICVEFEFPKTRALEISNFDGKGTNYVAYGILLNAHLTKCSIYWFGSAIPTAATPVNGEYQFEALLLPVRYTTKRATPSPTDYLPIYNPKTLEHLGVAIAPHSYTKSEDWAYEKECRFFVRRVRDTIFHDGCYFVSSLTKYITRVILGAKCDKTSSDVLTLMHEANTHRHIPLTCLPALAKASYDPKDNNYNMTIN